jgi:Domain of unknown function (DUF6265)
MNIALVSFYLVLSLVSPLRTQVPNLDELGWLAGSWQAKDGKVEEHWTRPAGDLMLGMNRDLSRPKRAFFEYLRIERRADGIYYVASPMGQGNADFKLVELSGDRVTFENPAHDFPKRIIYERTGPNTMKATVVGDSPASAISWSWQRLDAK